MTEAFRASKRWGDHSGSGFRKGGRPCLFDISGTTQKKLLLPHQKKLKGGKYPPKNDITCGFNFFLFLWAIHCIVTHTHHAHHFPPFLFVAFNYLRPTLPSVGLTLLLPCMSNTCCCYKISFFFLAHFFSFPFPKNGGNGNMLRRRRRMIIVVGPFCTPI